MIKDADRLPFELPDEMPRFRKKQDVFDYLETTTLEIPKQQRIYLEEVSDMFLRTGHFFSSPGEMVVHGVIKETYYRLGMYAFVSKRWIEPFAAWIGDRRILEVMSGAGHIAYALENYGVKALATDNMTWLEDGGWTPLVEIEKLDAVEAVEKYGAEVDIVLVSWPFMDDTAYRVLKKLHDVNPAAVLVYIGEYGGGCTADAQFHRHLDLIDNDDGFNKASKCYQHWAALHDGLYLGRYREG